MHNCRDRVVEYVRCSLIKGPINLSPLPEITVQINDDLSIRPLSTDVN